MFFSLFSFSRTSTLSPQTNKNTKINQLMLSKSSASVFLLTIIVMLLQHSSFACAQCPAGFWFDAGFNDRCHPCRYRYYCPGWPREYMIICPRGTYSNQQTEARLCELCPSGQSSDPGQFDCYNCPSGTYCPDFVGSINACKEATPGPHHVPRRTLLPSTFRLSNAMCPGHVQPQHREHVVVRLLFVSSNGFVLSSWFKRHICLSAR